MWGRSLMVSFMLGALGLVAAPVRGRARRSRVTGGLVAPGAEPRRRRRGRRGPRRRRLRARGARRRRSSRPSGPPTRSSGGPTATAAATAAASSIAATTARARSPTRCTAPTCSAARSTRRRSCAGASPARGDWITVYTNPGHAYVVIAGLRLDTSAAGDPSGARGPRWRPTLRSSRGFRARHPEGL